MNYYPFHIGDFRSGTINMSRQTRWIYRDMLDIYYDAENPLSLDLDVLCDEIGAESDDERRIVERLLRFKFIKTDDGYRHETCDRVIAEYRAKAETAKSNGKLGGRPRKAIAAEDKPSGFQSGSYPVASGVAEQTGSEANQEPRTNNQEPVNPTPKKSGAVTAADLSIAARKAGVQSQSGNPVLITMAAQGITPEIMDAACAEAKRSKPDEQIGFGYVAKIIERWAKEAETLKVQGAAAPKKSAGAWWASETSILAKGLEFGMKPNNGEWMPQFKGRIDAAIANGGKPPDPPPSPVIVPLPESPKGPRPPGMAPLKSLVKMNFQRDV